MKKIVSLVLCLMLLLGTVSALADIDITTEEVTLRYATNGEDP